MIIGQNKHVINTTRVQILNLVDQINKNLESYSHVALPAVKPAELSEFAKNPKGYFHEQVMAQAKSQGMEGVDPVEYARLYKLKFAPETGGVVQNVERLLEYVKMKKGRVVVVEDMEDRVNLLGIAETSTPEQDQAARLLLKAFSDYTYLATLMHGGSGVFSAGTHHFGFNAMQPGQLSIDSVNRLAEAMQRLPREEFNKRLEEVTANPGLVEINNPKN